MIRNNSNIENKRSTFFLIGLVVALSIVWIGFEWRTYERGLMDLGELEIYDDDIIVPITIQRPLDPPKPVITEFLKVVDDDIQITEVILESSETSENDSIDFIEKIEEVETDEVFYYAMVENKPVFEGCESLVTEDEKFECFTISIVKHISKNFKINENARMLNIQGRIFVNFVIEKNGNVSNVTVVRGIDDELDKEAIRVVKSLPKFTPAKQSGRAVRIQYTVPINVKYQ